MKKSLMLLLSLFIINFCHAQNDNVYISLAMTNDNAIDTNVKSILKNKLQQMLSINNISGTEYSAIVLIPQVDIINNSTIAGGMRKIYSLELSVTLTVKNLITNSVYNTTQLNCKGEGYSVNEAKRSAINVLDTNNPGLQGFIEKAKVRIIDYYNANVTAMITKANALAAQQQYDQALALLSTFPESLKSYNQVSETIVKIFTECKAQYCNQILIAAQAAYAKGDLEEASNLVSTIDATSSCNTEAKSLLSSIRKDLNKRYDDAMEFEREKMQSEERMTNSCINAAKEIAVAYYNRQTEIIFF